MKTPEFMRQAQDLIPFVPPGYPIKVRIKKNRNGNPIVINDRGYYLDSDIEDQEVDRIKLKNEDVELENVDYGDIYREKYWSWQFLKNRWRDYLELYEGDKGKYAPADLDADDWADLVSTAEAQNEWDAWHTHELRKTFEAWKEDSKLEKWLPYIVLFVVIVGQIVMMKQQSTTLAEQGDRIIKQLQSIKGSSSSVIPVMLAGTGARNRVQDLKDRLLFWRR